jgi:hypothetical protein
MLLIGLRLICRINWIAVGVLAVVLFLFQASAFEFYEPAMPICAVIAGIITFLLVRVGLLALSVCFFASNAIGTLPVTSDFSSWYAGQTVAMIVVTMTLAVYGFFTALAGQKLLSGDPFDARR